MNIIYDKAMEDLSHLPTQFQFEVGEWEGGGRSRRNSSEDRGIRGSLGRTGLFKAG